MKEIWPDIQVSATEFAVVSVPLGLDGEKQVVLFFGGFCLSGWLLLRCLPCQGYTGGKC